MTENDEPLKEAGLKLTHPRVRILELFQSDPETHYSAEEVHNYLIKKNNLSLGVFGKSVSENYIIKDNDRVELYEPALMDARELRISKIKKSS